MAISRINPSTSSSGGGATTQFITLPDSNRYVTTMALASGVYSVAGTTANIGGKVEFLDANNAVITSATFTATTPTVISLATPATKVRAYANPYKSDGYTPTGSIQVGISLTGLTALTNSYSGTVTTYTTTQAISLNGTAYVIAIGGGGGGNGADGNGYGGGGGGSGAVIERFATNWSGAYTLTIGSGGSGVKQTGNGGSASGGSTILANAGGTIFTAGGGLTGGFGSYGGNGGGSGSASGTYDFAGGSGGAQGQNGGGSNNGNITPYPYPFKYQWAKPTSVQGGFGGSDYTVSPIQQNLNNGNGLPGANGGNATGYGNGGGGLKNNGSGGNGSSGALYVITGLQEA